MTDLRERDPQHPSPPRPGTGVRVLLLDDDPHNLYLRATILRQHGYECLQAASIEDAVQLIDSIDIAVLDYHLGGGQFGTEVGALLRRRRPHIPIIILSATLERFFGGVEDMHLLKGYSSIDDLLNALSSLGSKRRGSPVIDARDFFYSRIARAIGADVLVQIFDDHGVWHFCNDRAADYLGHPRDWYPGRCIFDEIPGMRDWRDVLLSVPRSRETYIDRSHRGLRSQPTPNEQELTWSVLAFPLTLHDDRSGVVLTARVISHEGDLG